MTGCMGRESKREIGSRVAIKTPTPEENGCGGTGALELLLSVEKGIRKKAEGSTQREKRTTGRVRAVGTS